MSKYFLIIALVAFFWILSIKSANADYCCICKNSSGDCGWPNNTNCWGKPEMQPSECTIAACKEWCSGPGNPMEAIFRSQNCSILSDCAGSVPPILQTHCCVTSTGCKEVSSPAKCAEKIYLTTTCDMVKECSKPPVVEKETPVVVPKLQVEIPGFEGFSKDIEICLEEGKSLEECEKGQRGYAIPWIGEYIVAIYKWSVGAIAIIAIIMIMVGGFQWLMAAGNVGKISDAKSRITYAVIGLILILGSNLVLTSINPTLTIFPPIIVGKIERIELSGELSDTGIADQTSQGIYFKQCDSRWGTMAYVEENNEKCNLCSSGCGPTSVAIILRSKGIEVTPREVGQLAIEVGARKGCSGGTNLSLLIPATAQKWGLKTETTNDFNKAIQYLDKGAWLITSIKKIPISGKCKNSKCGEGICFCDGHFIVLAGKTGDTINVIDPSRYNLTSLSVNLLKKHLTSGRFYNIWK